MFNQASPESIIISIDVNQENIKWKNEKGIYLNKDFTTYNWGNILKQYNVNEEDVLVFFDDHQNALRRIKWIRENTNFKKIMFEDNYPTDQGDCVSIKKILSKKDYLENGVYTKFNENDFNYLASVIKEYYEFPPLYSPKHTRFGNLWTGYDTPEPLFNEPPACDTVEYKEMLDYTWICYLELN